MEHALLLLVYYIAHDEAAATAYLPWVHAGLRFLGRMRHGEPVSSVVSATRHILRRIRPEYDLTSISDETIEQSLPLQPPVRMPSQLSQPERAGRSENDCVLPHVPGQFSLWDEDDDTPAMLEGGLSEWLDFNYNLPSVELDNFLSVTAPSINQL